MVDRSRLGTVVLARTVGTKTHGQCPYAFKHKLDYDSPQLSSTFCFGSPFFGYQSITSPSGMFPTLYFQSSFVNIFLGKLDVGEKNERGVKCQRVPQLFIHIPLYT